MAVYEVSDMDQKSFIGSPASGNKSWGGGSDPSDSPKKSRWHFPWIGRSRIEVDVLRSWSPPASLIRPSSNGQINSPHWVFSSRCQMRPSSPTPQCPQPVCHPSKFSPAYRAYPRNNPGKTFFPNWWILDWSFAVIGWYSTNEPNGIIGPLKRLPKTSFSRASSHQIINLWRFADRCNIPWNLPTNFQTWLQQYRGAFLYSAQCSFSNPICFWFVWCWRTMNPGKIFTSFAEFQGIVSVNKWL